MANVVVIAGMAIGEAAFGVPVKVRARLRVRDLALNIVVGPCTAVSGAGAMCTVRGLALLVGPAAPGGGEDLRPALPAHSGPALTSGPGLPPWPFADTGTVPGSGSAQPAISSARISRPAGSAGI